jgi:pantoate--beta-alanine ligase
MGWLHDGHRALMARARAENATAVVSIFVNPRQFGDPADLAQYPRSESRDLEICEAEGVDLVFAPSVEEVYPPGFDTVVAVGSIARPLEGAARPGHFDGVATVVAILFGLVRADRAYFGQKDAQQVAVIRRMAIDLAIPTEVIACPTIREPDGLAMSSRNAYLSAAERARAAAFPRALREAAGSAPNGSDARALEELVRRELEKEGLAVDYVEVVDPVTMRRSGRVVPDAALAAAIRLGKTRLIDNVLLRSDEEKG